jgi:probable HAF family extracellular repeat protein
VTRTLLFVFALSFVIPAANSQTYSILDLGPLQPAAINSWAQVAGTTNGQATLWSPGRHPQSLGILPGGTASSALGLNDRGVVVGIADGPVTVVGPDGPFTCTDALQGFEWSSNGGLQGMGLMVLGGTNPCEGGGGETDMFTYANAVNDLNQSVGTIFWAGNTYVDGFGWKNPTKGMDVIGALIDLNLVYELTETNAINNRNQMVGAVGCCVDLNEGHALYWNHQTASDLGTLGGPDSDFYYYCSNARGINDVDQVVGWSTTIAGEEDFPCGGASSESPHAFLWTQARGMQDLGTLPGDTMSMAYAINLFGQVIGTSGNSTIEPEYNGIEYGGHMSVEVVGHPFVWTQRNGMQDLNTLLPSTSGWVLNTATGINAWGQIVGSGVHNGETHGFLLTPRL